VKKKKAVVIHSGGMDSSLCLALAIHEFGKKNVLGLSFRYRQRHSNELDQASKIAREWDVDHVVLNLDCLQEITDNALINTAIPIEHPPDQPPNTLVAGRNGLMARLGAIHANHLGASCIFMGVMGMEGANSGYRDCSRAYMDLKQAILRMDFGDPSFEIRTPLINMTKKETIELAHELEILDFLLQSTISCYEGIPRQGCLFCPACKLRNEGLREFSNEHPGVTLPYSFTGI
jgi:7-cyano-7-deazaguanine synthase